MKSKLKAFLRRLKWLDLYTVNVANLGFWFGIVLITKALWTIGFLIISFFGVWISREHVKGDDE